MSEDEKVTVSHPVTGATREVTRVRADSLRGMGWQVTESTPRVASDLDKPDVKSGRKKLAAATGKQPEPLPATKTAKKAAKRTARKHAASAAEAAAAEPTPEVPAEAEDPASPDSAAMKAEAETGHAGLQVDDGASNA